ncbi:hypothetical protein ACGH7X_00490 [Streptomyces sp. BBFR51]|uniref:hypothetical protein n=1 Tax=Streptomyces sp. BBFR51 TaxID=3372856 RepID=UPI0037DD448A
MKSEPQKLGWFKEFDDPEPSARRSRRPVAAPTGRPADARAATADRYRAGEDTG